MQRTAAPLPLMLTSNKVVIPSLLRIWRKEDLHLTIKWTMLSTKRVLIIHSTKFEFYMIISMLTFRQLATTKMVIQLLSWRKLTDHKVSQSLKAISNRIHYLECLHRRTEWMTARSRIVSTNLRARPWDSSPCLSTVVINSSKSYQMSSNQDPKYYHPNPELTTTTLTFIRSCCGV